MAPRAFTRRRAVTSLAGATVATIAAAEAMSGTAAADDPTSQDLEIPLYGYDFSEHELVPVDLGTGGVSRARVTISGDLAVLSYRALFGTESDAGEYAFCLDAADLPSAYQPKLPGDDVQPVGQAEYIGSGYLVDVARTAMDPLPDPLYTQYLALVGWANFSLIGPATPLLFWSVGPANTNVGDGTVNFGGTVPFGSPLHDGTTLYASITYLRDEAIVAPVPTTTTTTTEPE